MYTFTSCGLVAQWIERLPPEQKAVGSNPIKPTKYPKMALFQRFQHVSHMGHIKINFHQEAQTYRSKQMQLMQLQE